MILIIIKEKITRIVQENIEEIEDDSYKHKHNLRVCNSIWWNHFRPDFGDETSNNEDGEWWCTWGKEVGPRPCYERVKTYNAQVSNDPQRRNALAPAKIDIKDVLGMTPRHIRNRNYYKNWPYTKCDSDSE